MFTLELVFIPSPGAGHLLPSVELAKLLLHRDQRLSVTIIAMNLLTGAKHNETRPCTPRLRVIDIPCDDSTMALITPQAFLSAFVEHHKPRVRDIVRSITESGSVRLVGFVVDMFCMTMTDVANKFGAPTYTYFTSSAAMLGLMFYLQAKRDNEGYDVTELKNSDWELSAPSHVNPLPTKVLPKVVFDKEGGTSNKFLDLGKRFRESKGIIVNTFQDLETHALGYLINTHPDIPPVFSVGPILNLENQNDGKNEEIMRWLNDQPECSVVFLCFGTRGSFNEKQVKEIAVAIERSGHRFLWSLRRPASKEIIEDPAEYENLEEVLPKGFLERTSSVGKVIGWAPQMAVLSHPSVGGFVSHCGWNSTLESIWCGIPIAAWPLYAEQHLNAFQLVVELEMASEIRMDYRTDTRATGGGNGMVVTAEEIENGIRKLMSDDEMRKKVKDMKEKSRSAVVEGGSSYTCIGKFIDHLMNYVTI